MPLPDDDLAIRDLAARYIDAVNRDDTPAWAATWARGPRRWPSWWRH